MAAPHICVAGISPVEGTFIRPVRGYDRLDASDLRANGGLFALGDRLHLGEVVPRPSPPESEDVVFNADNVRRLGQLSGPDLWAILSDSAEGSLAAIFGADLEGDGNTASMAVGIGNRSLGHLRPRSRPALEIDFGKPRLRLTDPGLGALRLPVTDLRLLIPALASFRNVHCSS
jgi:Dual OB-containing domain